jgi:hypothetical protein
MHVNHPPDIASIAAPPAYEDSLFTFKINVTDPDTLVGDVLQSSLIRKPSWLSINSTTNVVYGTPHGANVGDTVATVKVIDGKGGVATQAFPIHITHTNHVPVFVTSALPIATEDALYTTRLWVTDQDSSLFGDRTKYRFYGTPSPWLVLDSVSGLLSGTPQIENLKDTVFVIEAYDGKGGTVQRRFSVLVFHINHPPEIFSIAPTSAKEDSLYRYQLIVYDVDTLVGDVMHYTLTRHPAWLGINAQSGLVSGTPQGVNVGDTLATVHVSDSKGGTATQTFSIAITHTNHAPVFATTVLPAATEDSLYTTQLWATDQDSSLFGDRIAYRFTTSSSWLSIDSVSGRLTGTPRIQNLKDTLFRIEAADEKGGFFQKTFLISIAHTNHSPVFVTNSLPVASEDTL